MSSNNKIPAHPGTFLKEHLESLGLSQTQLAEHLGWTYARLNEIINLRRGITADSALSFGEAFGMSPEFWLNLQTQWDLWSAQKKHTTIPLLVQLKDT